MSKDELKEERAAEARVKAKEVLDGYAMRYASAQNDTQKESIKEEGVGAAYDVAAGIDASIRKETVSRMFGAAITNLGKREQATAKPAEQPSLKQLVPRPEELGGPPENEPEGPQEPEPEELESERAPESEPAAQTATEEEQNRTIGYIERLLAAKDREHKQEMEETVRKLRSEQQADMDRLAEKMKQDFDIVGRTQEPARTKETPQPTPTGKAGPARAREGEGYTEMRGADGSYRERYQQVLNARFDAVVQKILMDDYRKALFAAWKAKKGYPGDMGDFIVDCVDEFFKTRGVDLQYVESRRAMPADYYQSRSTSRRPPPPPQDEQVGGYGLSEYERDTNEE